LVESGQVYSTYMLEQQIAHALVRQQVTIYHALKRIYFNTELRNWDGTLYREFRTAFPVNMENAEVAHEVPFGRVRVGKDEIKTAGERYTPLCKDVHPRAIIDWISATDDEMTITLSSSVAAADWVDPTELYEGETMLQHLLLASRTSCHWEGNEYSQAGQHSFHNVLTSNKSGSTRGERIAKQKNEPLHVVLYPETVKDASLPESASFLSIDSEEVYITAVKKAEDTEEVIVRMYNVGEQEEEVSLSSTFNVKTISKTNIIEENPTRVGKILPIGEYSIETFSLKMDQE